MAHFPGANLKVSDEPNLKIVSIGLILRSLEEKGVSISKLPDFDLSICQESDTTLWVLYGS